MISEAIVLALAIAVMSVTISKTHVFQPLRMLVFAKANDHPDYKDVHKHPKLFQWLYELLQCPYCLSHWFSMILVPVYDIRLVNTWYPLDWFISSMAVTCVATFAGAIVYRAYRPPQNRERVRVGQTRTTEATSRGNS